ncbi:MAG: metallophosphoesterase [Thalassobaculaceae bacterium]|nr:metallophosphoesterase [Thalassobaculaceae bacterium]
MKLIHISDIHIHDEQIQGQHPIANFTACLAHVETHHRDADRVVISGDLTHHGRRRSYEQLREIVLASPLNPRLMIGNHDDRGVFRAVFPDVPVDANGYVQYAEDTAAGRFLYLDTVEPGTHAGRYGADRQSWLAGELLRARADGTSVYIFMHHHPCPVGARSADMIGLIEGPSFRALLAEYRDVVRHVFFGHCHFILSGSVCGIPMSAPRSTNHPNAPDLVDRGAIAIGPLAPSYNVVLIDDDSTVVHTIDFLLESQIQWIPIQDDGWIDEGTAAG